MTNVYSKVSKNKTPQTEPLLGQVKNSAGGYSYQVDEWTLLDRFLILGTAEPTYYAQNVELRTREAATNVQACLAKDGIRVVNRIVEISQAGRAPKNDPALFALALACADDNQATRQAAFNALPKVARIGTHLFHFAEFVNNQRGWGRGLRSAIASWYLDKNPDKLAYQLAKYRQRDGWSHRDLLRLAHPEPKTKEHDALFAWVTQDKHEIELPVLIMDFERAQTATQKKEILPLIEAGLTWEMFPTPWHKEPWFWQALVEKGMPMGALVRNLGRMTAIEALKPGDALVKKVVDQLSEESQILSARLHPISVLAALMTYRNGQGMRGSTSWTPIAKITDALDAAFYLSFGTVKPTNARTMLALDISGSMTWPNNLMGVMGMTPRVGSAAMSMVTARVEQDYLITGFSTELTPLNISPRQRLDDVVQEVSRLRMGGTDCALPMQHALKHGLKFDAFVVYTDNETWHGQQHPVQALREYRVKTGIPALLIVVGMVSNSFSIADPTDGGMLDIVGFDTATPNVISDFVRGPI